MMKKSNRPTPLKHQIEASQKLITTCDRQHGLVVNHQTGTGKTITGLLFIMYYLEHNIPVILIIPETLHVVWQMEMNNFGMKFTKNFQVMYYDKIHKSDLETRNLEGTVIVCDEAHNLIDQLYEDYHINMDLVNNLYSCEKILLLTATPIYHKEQDLFTLANLAAGKTLFSYNNDKFLKKYKEVKNIGASLLKGWIIPIIGTGLISKILFEYPSRGNMVPMLLSMLSLPKGIINYSKKIGTVLEIPQKKIVDPIAKGLVSNNINFIRKNLQPNDYLIEGDIDPNSSEGKLMVNRLLPLGIVMFALLVGLVTLIAKTIDTYRLTDAYIINKKKIIQDISPYISYYKNTEDDPNYPTSTITYVPVEYGKDQIEIWCNVLFGSTIYTDTTTNKRIKVEINVNNQVEYLYLGRMIGNLGEMPPKFEKIFKKMAETNYKQIVIYSSFNTEGIQLFMSYLDKFNINHKTLLPKMTVDEKTNILGDFKNKKIDVLLLHPLFTEGISVLGARQMHILEPLLDMSQFTQLVGRCVRYHSHTHLPSLERHVDIYVWYSTGNNMINSVRKKIIQYEIWFKYFKAVVPMKLVGNYDKDLTPDFIVLQKQKNITQVLDFIQKTNVNRCAIDY